LKNLCETPYKNNRLWRLLEAKSPKWSKKYPKSITFIDKKSRRAIFSENLIKPMEDEENFLRVLSTAVISLTKIFLPNMIKERSGNIMIVSSVAAYAPPSKIQSLYGPVKTFMNRFSEAINLSYNDKGVFSTALCPGYTVTNFHTASGVQDEMDSVPKFLKKSALRIAKEGVDGMIKKKKVVVPTKTWKMIVFLLKIVPKIIFDILSSVLAPGRYTDKGFKYGKDN